MIDEHVLKNMIYATSQIVCAHVEAMGMASDNHMRHFKGEMPVYTHCDFVALMDKYGLHHNAILTTLQG